MYAILRYLYRDASNWKTFGAVAFANPDEIAAPKIAAAIRAALEGGAFFVAESLDLPTLYHDVGDPNWADQAHGYHEFNCIETEKNPPVWIKRDNRTIAQLIEIFTAESEKGWSPARNLAAEMTADAD